MSFKRAYRVEVDPNATQRAMMARSCGAARFAYNWGLAACIEARKNGDKRPTGFDLGKRIVVEKNSGSLGWLKEVSKCAPQIALLDLDTAFQNFFRRCKQGAKGRKAGFPKFKKRKDGIGGYAVNDRVTFTDTHVRLPKLGNVRLKQRGYVPSGKYGMARIKEKNGRWYVTVVADHDPEPVVTPDMPVVGVDLGVKALATLSDGTVIANEKHARRGRRKIRRLQKCVSRRVKGSNRRRAAVRKLAIAHERVAARRKDAIHKFTTALTRNTSVIGIEDLSVSGMLKNRRLSSAVADASFYEIRRQIEYKASWYGAQVVVVDRFAPTSKTCSQCGHVKDALSLSERTFACEHCGASINRDLNAALNIQKLAVSYIDSLNGRGEASAGGRPVSAAKLASAKRQESASNIVLCYS